MNFNFQRRTLSDYLNYAVVCFNQINSKKPEQPEKLYMPDGQPRRMLDTTLALQEFGFKPRHLLRKGLKKLLTGI